MNNEEENLPTTVKEKLQEAAVRYSEFTELRTVVNLIPGIGSAIDFVISNEVQKIQAARIVKTMRQLKEEMSQIDNSKIDKSFIHSEQFSDLLLGFLERVIRVRDRDKMILYCKMLAGSVKIENAYQRQFAEDMIYMLSNLSLVDLKVAQETFMQQSNMPEKFDEEENTELKFIVGRGWHNIRMKLNLTEIDFDISVRKLDRAGLLKEMVGMYLGYSGGLYLITPAFKRLMEFVRFNANEPIFTIS